MATHDDLLIEGADDGEMFEDDDENQFTAEDLEKMEREHEAEGAMMNDELRGSW